MNSTIIAVSQDVKENKLSEEHLKALEVFSGKAAGICYMKDDYFDSYVSDPAKAEKRFENVAPTGHHSIGDHSFVSVLFEGIPKMTAMILNNFGFYNTSEKSGRYTVMSVPEDYKLIYSDNFKLYNKWTKIFDMAISEYDSGIDEKHRNKLALENARYVLSIFAPSTVMAYTTSLRMWSYIRTECERYIKRNENFIGDTKFNKALLSCIKDLYNRLTEMHLYSDSILENKGREINFLAKQTSFNIWEADESYSDAYIIKYKSSLAGLAQEQRHRTLQYFMCFDGSDMLKFYVPKIIRDAYYEKEWLDDLRSVADTFPIATLVDVVETGLITDFMYKCDERLCGRVQLETMDNVRINLLKFARSWHKSPFFAQQIQKHFRDGKVIMKCGNIKCQEPCYWGPIKAQERLI